MDICVTSMQLVEPFQHSDNTRHSRNNADLTHWGLLLASAFLHVMPGPIFCLLLGISSGCARPITGQVTSINWPVIGWAQSLARSKLRLCSANHRAGYFSNLACDWLSTVWAYSQETKNELTQSKRQKMVPGQHQAITWTSDETFCSSLWGLNMTISIFTLFVNVWQKSPEIFCNICDL